MQSIGALPGPREIGLAKDDTAIEPQLRPWFMGEVLSSFLPFVRSTLRVWSLRLA
jgi:hypothetical protein